MSKFIYVGLVIVFLYITLCFAVWRDIEKMPLAIAMSLGYILAIASAAALTAITIYLSR